MDLYLILLRLVHIFAATFWVGAALLNVGFLEPTVRAAGPEGGRFMTRLVQDAHLSRAIAITSLLTILSGLLLYWRVSGGLTWDWISTNSGLSFTVGSIAGLTAFVLGLTYIAPAASRLSVLGAELQTVSGPPGPTQLRELHLLQARLRQASFIETPLIIVAVVTMAIARYL